MKNLIASLDSLIEDEISCELEGEVQIEKEKLFVSVIPDQVPHFNEKDDQYANYVLVKKRAFSCNYRDKGILLLQREKISAKVDRADKIYYTHIGSEFVAD